MRPPFNSATSGGDDNTNNIVLVVSNALEKYSLRKHGQKRISAHTRGILGDFFKCG
jgi:hypothetical protein